jgi:hypothetical protein
MARFRVIITRDVTESTIIEVDVNGWGLLGGPTCSSPRLFRRAQDLSNQGLGYPKRTRDGSRLHTGLE